MLRVGMPFWTLCVLFVFVALCVARRFGEVSDVCLRLETPFRPSATYFDGAKVGNPLAPFPARLRRVPSP
ncbi:hypothetical protein CFN58_08725 [Pseudomonas avellanae]|uniref:Uncharacterized protein n=1 Tax=Pseudomonas avellanae TaxID=46257 RepID=A0A261WL32_9PSED|nr:hypothetical protein CFN58_08725 [Pseudomonas avellanae]